MTASPDVSSSRDAGPDPPDRFADAVRARRVELRERAAVLGRAQRGEHRAALRTDLVLARATAVALAHSELAELRREAEAHIATADRVGRAALPGLVVATAARVEQRAHDGWARAAEAAARRAVARCGLRVAVRWPRPVSRWPRSASPPSQALDPLPAGFPDPPPPVRLREVVADASAWRLAVLPAAVAPVVLLPLAGLPADAGPRLLPPALGLGVLVLVLVVGMRRVAVARSRLQRHADAVLTTVRARLDADLGTRILACERDVAAHLDTRLPRERGSVDEELTRLAPHRTPEPEEAP